MLTVKVEDLKKMVDELEKDKIEYVEISLLEGDEDIPEYLNFNAFDGEGGGVDYGDIEHVEVDAFYKV
jgi:hypothetical protein